MWRRKWVIVLASLALLVFGFWMWWRAPHSSIKREAEKLKPELKIASLNISDIDENKMKATSKIILRNNLPVEVNAKRLDYIIYIDSAKVIEDAYSTPITIHSRDTTMITLPMEIMFKKLGAVLERLENKHADSADYSMVATFGVDVPIAGNRNFTMHFSKRLPTLRLPKATMADINIGKPGLKESSLDLTVNIENPNVFSIKMKDAKYKFSINDDKNIMEGVTQKVIDIPAHKTAPVVMHLDMKTMKIPKLGWKMFFDKRDTHFNMNFTGNLMSENRMFNNSTMVFNMSGTLDELKNAVMKQ
jgi:LEA14-like dessication related protein